MRITVNGEVHEIGANTTIAELLHQLEHRDDSVAVAVNLKFVPRAQRSQHMLREQDEVEIVAPIAGG